MGIIVNFIFFALMTVLVTAGPYPNQTNVPKNFNCGCSGYLELAKKCHWKQKKCNKTSIVYRNYKFWCNTANLYLQDRREGNTRATYNRQLLCNSNISQDEWQRTHFGIQVPETPSPGIETTVSGFEIVPPTTTLPTYKNWMSSMTPVKSQGSCNSCWAFVCTGICEWWYTNKTSSAETTILSVC